MQHWRGLDQIPPGWGRCVVTIGVFDGVHLGHQALIDAVVAKGAELGLPAVLMTFDPHPSEIIRAGSHPAMLTSLRRRAELAAERGVDVFLVVPFTQAFSQIEPDEFVHDILVGRLHAAAVLVGENFRFGHRGAGDLELLQRLGRSFGFAADGLCIVDGGADPVAVTSTYVRSCVAAGDMAAVTAALGRPHRIEGIVVRGEGRGGSELGYPTANLDVAEHTAIPADGVYAGWFLLGGRRSPAAISVGTNPTFSGQVRTIEAFVIDGGANFYGRRVAVEFVQRIRGQIAFDSVPDLIAAIDQDVAQIRQILGVPASGPTAVDGHDG